MEHSLNSLWKSIADAIRPHVSADTFQRWFKPVELAAADEETLTLRVPNNIFQHWIEINYLSLLNASILTVLGSPRTIRFIVAHEKNNTEQAPTPTAHRPPGAKKKTHPASDSCKDEIPNAPGLTTGSDAPAAANGMNPRYTFETFVVGTNNELAHAAALAVAQAPAKTYNPLFIHGGVGLGKTHLMQAIGQHCLGAKKGAKALYVTCERFTNEFIEAIQSSTLIKFRKRYRHVDILLIDDIQFLAGKNSTQEEFFHTFNELQNAHKQIVLSSDRPPAELNGLEQRLVSRFDWGLTAEMGAPDIETRLAILRKKMESMHVRVPDSVLEFLAKNIRSNVRRLEGALVRVSGFLSLNGKLDFDAIEKLLKDVLQEEAKRVITIDQIQKIVAEHYDVRLVDMTSKRRPANIAWPRQVAMYLAREMTKLSLNEIGEAFGGRDHGTVLHAQKLVREKIEKDEGVRRKISALQSQLSR